MFNKAPTVYSVNRLLSVLVDNHTQTEVSGNWVPARPLGYPSIWNRLRATWLVFTGQADAVKWEKQ